MLKSPADGHLFPLSRIGTITVVTGQAEINRENLRRMDAVTARVVGRDTGSAAAEVQRHWKADCIRQRSGRPLAWARARRR